MAGPPSVNQLLHSKGKNKGRNRSEKSASHQVDKEASRKEDQKRLERGGRRK